MIKYFTPFLETLVEKAANIVNEMRAKTDRKTIRHIMTFDKQLSNV